MARTHFRNVDWIVAWDALRGSHVYLRDADLVIDGNTITHVGAPFADDADVVVDGRECCLMPGLVDIHAHPASEVFYRGIREDHSVPAHYMTGLFERACAYRIDPDDLHHGGEVSYADLVLSGVTTLVDVTFPYPGWTELMARSGLRVYAAPGFNTSSWTRPNAHTLGYREDAARGERDFEAALALIDQLRTEPGGRLCGIVSPFQIDNNSTEMLRASRAAARERGIPWTTHAAQAVLEVQEMLRRHGLTPIQYLAEHDLLGPGTIIAHAIFADTSSWIRWHTNTDIALLAAHTTAIAHCPTPFMRYGAALEHLGAYRDAGVIVGIGTDTIPHNMLEDLRYAAVLARVAARDGHAASTADVFHAGTVGGATALGRDDLGRLAVGARADIVVLDLTEPTMMPVRDPIASLVHSSAERAVRDVYVDGVAVVRDGDVLTLDRERAAAHLRAGQQRMEAAVPARDFAARSSEDIAPLCLPMASA